MSVKLIKQIHMQKSHGFSPMCITKVTFASITSWSLLQCFYLFLFEIQNLLCSALLIGAILHLTRVNPGERQQATKHKLLKLQSSTWKKTIEIATHPPQPYKKKHMKSKNETFAFSKSIVAPFQIRSSHRFRSWKKILYTLAIESVDDPPKKKLKKHVHKGS